jgi:6-phosphogluconolactonase
MTIRVVSDAEALAVAAAELIADWFRSPDHRAFGIAGGSTPRRAYEVLRTLDVPWEEIEAWMTDERHVPLDHADSNAAMAADALFEHVPATLHPVPFGNDPASLAAVYERRVEEVLARTEPADSAGLVLLGMGDDGHTASLFPGTAAVDEHHRLYVENWLEDRGVWRFTATIRLLARAERTVFLVAGAAKAEAVRAVLHGDSYLPAALVARAAADPIWLLDEAAAALLG